MRTKKDFKKFYQRYVDDVAAFLHSYAPNRAQLKDWVHDVFIKIWDARESIDFDDPSIKGYLLTTARNHALKKLREQKTYDEWLDKNLYQLNNTVIQKDPEITSKNIREKYHQSLNKIPTRARQAYLLSREEGLTYSEIAEVMDISEKTVEAHIGKALQILREIFGDSFAQEMR